MPKVVTHNGQLVTLNGKALEVDAPDTPSITVDSALSPTSENPVQNKVITAALAEKITAPTTASVGQIIKVKTVDTAGKPTEWEAVTAKLANPNALTFTGAVTGSYDGSEAVNVEIPSGGESGTDNTYSAEYTLEEDVSQFAVNLPEQFHDFELCINQANGSSPTVNGIVVAKNSAQCNAVGEKSTGDAYYIGRVINKGNGFRPYLKAVQFTESNHAAVKWHGGLIRYSSTYSNAIIVKGTLYANNKITIRAR